MPPKSEKQRKFFGIVKSMQEGKTSPSYSPEAAKTAEEVKPSTVSEFAKKLKKRKIK